MYTDLQIEANMNHKLKPTFILLLQVIASECTQYAPRLSQPH